MSGSEPFPVRESNSNSNSTNPTDVSYMISLLKEISGYSVQLASLLNGLKEKVSEFEMILYNSTEGDPAMQTQPIISRGYSSNSIKHTLPATQNTSSNEDKKAVDFNIDEKTQLVLGGNMENQNHIPESDPNIDSTTCKKKKKSRLTFRFLNNIKLYQRENSKDLKSSTLENVNMVDGNANNGSSENNLKTGTKSSAAEEIVNDDEHEVGSHFETLDVDKCDLNNSKSSDYLDGFLDKKTLDTIVKTCLHYKEMKGKTNSHTFWSLGFEVGITITEGVVGGIVTRFGFERENRSTLFSLMSLARNWGDSVQESDTMELIVDLWIGAEHPIWALLIKKLVPMAIRMAMPPTLMSIMNSMCKKEARDSPRADS
ncbi:hypothetical protein BN7_3393 [Wickerhamomyces ciferrii]|uniref:Uncharacterized protein n=1 Tax=Wickerhamomyces ciferrii (strain ATCC 14091 / BCRC 22168 / CBS 111 / JCM 3599 / NBRC 0793 / NRRL Y-1031 F-60-10) TaxID=1206466 RepID=K0KRD8_WICCF|nr:uncharacterized protein BN7_3393 [Wickerhamomyces ciferrii]CCH43839.1 hypothetical protein BN7_3393 [Wickerhamomyces ciferrii]